MCVHVCGVPAHGQLHAVDVVQVAELHEGLHGDLAGAHAEVEERAGVGGVEVGGPKGLVRAPRQQLAVQ
jgi:hypothetical protein